MTGGWDATGAGALGLAGEDAACAELRRRGYEILARRYRTRRGEIDIVARDGGTVVFVEVKTRGRRRLRRRRGGGHLAQAAHASRGWRWSSWRGTGSANVPVPVRRGGSDPGRVPRVEVYTHAFRPRHRAPAESRQGDACRSTAAIRSPAAGWWSAPSRRTRAISIASRCRLAPDPHCPLCEGHEAMTPSELWVDRPAGGPNGPGWTHARRAQPGAAGARGEHARAAGRGPVRQDDRASARTRWWSNRRGTTRRLATLGRRRHRARAVGAARARAGPAARHPVPLLPDVQEPRCRGRRGAGAQPHAAAGAAGRPARGARRGGRAPARTSRPRSDASSATSSARKRRTGGA